MGLVVITSVPEVAVAGADQPWQESRDVAAGELPTWANVTVGIVFLILMAGSLFLGAGFFVSLMLSSFVTSLIVLLLIVVTSLAT